MKKLLAVLVVFALIAGTAFAQVNLGAWGRAAITPLKFVGANQINGSEEPGSEGEAYVFTRTTWGGGIRVGVSLSGWSDFVGFNLDINGDDVWNVGAGDFVSIWAKPFSNDFLKITAGKFNEDALRGKLGEFTASDIHDLYRGGHGNDDIFNRFQAWKGFLLSSSPMDGLFIGLLVKNDSDDFLAPVAYREMQIGAGYNIDGIGHVRLQYVGGWSGTWDTASKDDMKYFQKDDGSFRDNPSRIEFAFALTAVDNLLVDLGFKYNLPITVKTGTIEGTVGQGAQLALAAKYNMDALGIGFRFDMSGLGAGTTVTGGGGETVDGVNTGISFTPTYNLGPATIGLDFGLQMKSASTVGGTDQKDQETKIAFGAYVNKGLGNGVFTAGVGVTLPPSGNDGANGRFKLVIPLILEYWF